MHRAWRPLLLVSLGGLSIGCGAEPAPDAGRVDGGPPPAPAADYFEDGPFPVGNVRLTLEDRARGRSIPVELWYPADEASRAAATAGQPLAAFEREAPRDAELAALLADAPTCVRTRTRSADAPDPEPSGEAWPLVVFSHCHVCTRFDVARVAERLASFGVAVAAPDHEENTLWDELAGDAAAVGPAFLEVRVADLAFVIDAVLAGDGLSATLRGRFDAARVGAMGHSFGAATVGVLAARDPRVVAGLAMTAPLTALGGGARITAIETPFLFLLAREDNSIGEGGNTLVRNEHRRIASDSLLVEVADAGHWSFSDYPGLVPRFAAGCGEGTRQTGAGEAFTYVDPDVARDIAADVAAAWFARHLIGDPGAVTPILGPHPSGLVEASRNR